MGIKLYKDWNSGSFYEFVKVGDIVDYAMVRHFMNVPAFIISGSCIQGSEPFSVVNDKYVYPTFERNNDWWTYKGMCFYGQRENKWIHSSS